MPTHRQHILVVEDDPAQRAWIASALKPEGYRVTTFDNGAAARRFLESQGADLMLLDWNLPGLDGDRLLRWLRGRSHSPLPVVFQSVHKDESDIVAILDCGADDYLIKPYDRSVLLARIRAVLRRYEMVQPGTRQLESGGVVFDHLAHSISHAGRLAVLGVKEFGIGWHLASRAGITVLRQDLLSAVWGIDGQIETRSVDMYVSRLRGKLREIGAARLRIVSVYGVGYRCDVLTDDAGESGFAQASAQDAAK